MQLTFTFRETWLHRVNPSLKLVLFVIFFVIVILIHNLNVMINLTFGLFILILWSGHPYKRLMLYTSPFILIFISTSTGMMMFGEGTTTWWKFGLIHITEESFFRGLHLGFRALNMAMAGLLIGLTSKPVYLFYSLMQQWKLPPKYAYSFLAAIRMLPLMLSEFQTLRHALKVRGVRRSYTPKGFYTAIKQYSIPLLAQSIRRAQRIAVAMESKRFIRSSNRTYYYSITYSYRDVVFVCYLAGIIWASLTAGTMWPYVSIEDVRTLG